MLNLVVGVAFCLIAGLLAPIQEASDLERRFVRLLGETEKAGIIFPDLSKAVLLLDRMAQVPGGDSLPRAAIDRHILLRARDEVYSALFTRLEKVRGGDIEFPLGPGRRVQVRVLELKKDSVVVRPSAGELEVRFQDLEIDWVVDGVRAEVLKSKGRPAVHLALVLANAGRWEPAFRELGTEDHPHPLIVETRRRAFDAAYAKAEEGRKAKRYAEALESLAAVAALAPGEARLAELRKVILKDLSELGRAQALRQMVKEMEATIAVIDKHYPDSGEVVKAIRDAARWYDITDPKLFGLDGKPGAVIVLNEKEGSGQTADLARMPAVCDAFSVRLRFPKGSGAQGGILWEGRAWTAWIIPAKRLLFVSRWDKARGEFVDVAEKPVGEAESWSISVFLRDGNYVVSCDDVVAARVPTEAVSHGKLSLNAEKGKVWFDSIWVRKKE
jgi:hypothetical protein